MSDEVDLDDEVEDEQVVVTASYIPENPDEWRRQWCVSIACYYFSGQDSKKAMQAAADIERFLKGLAIKEVK